jgi:hypothetical protein
MKSEAMEEHLVGYLLSTLDPVTHQRVEAYLRGNPDARARLALLEQALAPLAEDLDEPELPPSLVVSTLGRICEYRCALPVAPRPSPHQVGAPSRRWGRPVDWAVAALLLILVGGVATPLLALQWRVQQRTACADNLRRFWVGLEAYADRSESAFPRVEAEGPRSIAGIFVPILTDCGLACDASVVCPAQGKPEPARYTLSELDTLYKGAPCEYRVAARELAGNYAYCLGYQEGRAHRGLRRDTGDGLPILADRAGAPAGNSLNHGGSGQNVLYVGGNVRWCEQPTVGLDGDNIYVNRDNCVRAGVCRTDSVLAASDVQPYDCRASDE